MITPDRVKHFTQPSVVVVRRAEDHSLGGPGSGNFGHVGRPGQVGGSARTTKPALSSAEADAVGEFRFGSGYLDVNTYLRQSRKLDPERKQQVQSMIANIDSALKKARTSKSMRVYRGVKGSVADVLEKTKIGEHVRDKGFMSTTTKRDVAESFGRYGTVIEILVPENANILDVRAGRRAPAGYGTEAEMLLPRGTVLKKVSDSRFEVVLGRD